MKNCEDLFKQDTVSKKIWYYSSMDSKDLHRLSRQEKIKAMQLEKLKQQRRRALAKRFAPVFVLGIIILIVAVVLLVRNVKGGRDKDKAEDDRIMPISETISEEDMALLVSPTPKEDVPKEVYSASSTDDTRTPGEEIVSRYAIVIDMDNDIVLSERNAYDKINPASMTKVLTALVAAENLSEEDLDSKFTIPIEITDYTFKNDCSNVGFDRDETVTVRDLMYGTILPSGADAALGLAYYIAGSEEAFVELMNEKLEALGLSDSAHFTNCIGLYDENHYCTIYDMAMMMEAAMDNELCREVMSAHTYTTSKTAAHPDGITISNWFLRRIEDKDTGGEVVCGKTGYVVQSGNCAVSYGIDASGNNYICATADSTSGWRCIYDHVALYKEFAK